MAYILAATLFLNECIACLKEVLCFLILHYVIALDYGDPSFTVLDQDHGFIQLGGTELPLLSAYLILQLLVTIVKSLSLHASGILLGGVRKHFVMQYFCWVTSPKSHILSFKILTLTSN